MLRRHVTCVSYRKTRGMMKRKQNRTKFLGKMSKKQSTHTQRERLPKT